MISHRRAVEIIGVGAVDLHRHDVAGAQRATRGNMHCSVDLRGVRLAASARGPSRRRRARPPELAAACRSCARAAARSSPAARSMKRFQRLSLTSARRRRAARSLAARAADRLVLEGAGAVDLGLLQPIEQKFEILLRLAGKTDDESRAQGEIRADRAPRFDALQRLFLIAGARIAFSTAGAACWNGMSR